MIDNSVINVYIVREESFICSIQRSGDLNTANLLNFSSCFHGLESSSYPSRCLFLAAACLHLFYQHGYLFNHIVDRNFSIFRYQVALELEVRLEFIFTI
jgi:hypothetical protein